jgi:uncharacterized protein YoxC
VPSIAAFTWNDLADLALAVFLFAVGISLAYAFFRLGGTLARLSAFIKGAQEEVLPVINKVGGTVDRVNGQLDKVDLVTDSAVDAADAVDTAVRAVSAVERAKEAAARREREVAEELRRAGRGEP